MHFFEAAHNTVGDLEKPNSGLLFIAHLVEIYGLNKEVDDDYPAKIDRQRRLSAR